MGHWYSAAIHSDCMLLSYYVNLVLELARASRPSASVRFTTSTVSIARSSSSMTLRMRPSAVTALPATTACTERRLRESTLEFSTSVRSQLRTVPP